MKVALRFDVTRVKFNPENGGGAGIRFRERKAWALRARFGPQARHE